MDDRQFAEIYADTHARLWTYVYRLTGERALADDLVQDAYCKLLALPDDRIAAGAERAYLYRIATNLATDHHRRSTRLVDRLRALVLAGEVAAPAPGDDLQAIFARLPRREAALLWLAHVEGHDHRTIAEILGVRPASVRVLLSRARARLHALLQPEQRGRDDAPLPLLAARRDRG